MKKNTGSPDMATGTRAEVRVVDVYPYRRRKGNTEFLLLKRANSTDYAGQWRMVGGKIQPDETAWQTALRELQEELGSRPETLWALPSINSFYEWQHDRVNLIPAFAAEYAAPITLNQEHTAHAWLPASEATRRIHWAEQKRLLRLTRDMLRNSIPPELIIPPAEWPR